jgi:hypothetical protein
VSCRFHPEDKDVIEWFETLLRYFDLNIQKSEALTNTSAPVKVLADIQSADLLMAIVTSPLSAWIQNEIGIAYALGKPIIAAFEEGVEKGLCPYISDYIGFSRNDLNNSTGPATQLINSVLNRLDSQKHLFKGSTCSVQLISQDELVKILPEEIENSESLDLLAYTAESFMMNPSCHEAFQKNRTLKCRILLRDPSIDKRKEAVTSATFSFFDKLGLQNFQLRCYGDVPLLRAFIFDRSRGYVGLYRWDPNTHFEFIGGENNLLAKVKSDSEFDRLWLDLYKSRFDYEWQRSQPITLK